MQARRFAARRFISPLLCCSNVRRHTSCSAFQFIRHKHSARLAAIHCWAVFSQFHGGVDRRSPPRRVWALALPPNAVGVAARRALPIHLHTNLPLHLDGRPTQIEGMFTLAWSALISWPDSIHIQYDPVYNFPATIDVDPINQATDDEVVHLITDFAIRPQSFDHHYRVTSLKP